MLPPKKKKKNRGREESLLGFWLKCASQPLSHSQIYGNKYFVPAGFYLLFKARFQYRFLKKIIIRQGLLVPGSDLTYCKQNKKNLLPVYLYHVTLDKTPSMTDFKGYMYLLCSFSWAFKIQTNVISLCRRVQLKAPLLYNSKQQFSTIRVSAPEDKQRSNMNGAAVRRHQGRGTLLKMNVLPSTERMSVFIT